MKQNFITRARSGKKAGHTIAAAVVVTGMSSTSMAQLEEVIVTAQKREQSLQEVPIAMQAFGGDRLKDQGITQITDIVSLTPNVAISGQSASNRQINIRGVGTSDFFPNASGSVGIYMDEVTMSAPYLTSLGLHDIERVEVLRGPQNSLFGRNTTGGAVNFISVIPKPGEEVTGFIDATLANNTRIEIDGAVSLPLSDTAAVRLAAKSYTQDGVWNNLAENGSEFGEKDRYSIRATFAWDPNDNTSTVLSFRTADEDSDLDPVKAVGLRGANGSAWGGTTPPLGGPPQPNSNVPTSDIDFSRSYNSFNAQGDNPSTDRWEDVYVTGTHLNEVEAQGVYFKLTHDFESMAFTSISSYDDTSVFWSYDTGGIGNTTPTTVSTLANTLGLNSQPTPQPDLAIDMDLEFEGFSQELRLQSTGDGALRWIVGFYYFYEESDLTTSIRFGEYIGIPDAGDRLGGAFFGNGLLGDPDGFGNKAGFQNGVIENSLWSPYFNLDFDLSEKLSMNIGLRYTDDTKELTENYVGFISTLGDDLATQTYTKDVLLSRSAGSPECIADASAGGALPGGVLCQSEISAQREDNVTEEFGGKIGLNYQLNEEIMLYGHYSRGFRGGKHDIEFLHGPQTGWDLVDPGTEFLNAFEIGIKSDLLDGAMQLNAAIYSYTWEDQQAIFVNPAKGPEVLNIPESELLGLEVELKWAPADSWLIEAGIGLQDTEITKASGTGLDQEGHELPFASDTSANLLIVKDFEVGDGVLSAQFDWSYKSAPKAYARDVDYVDELEEQSKINVRFSYKFGDEEQYGVALWGENLTEEESCTYKWNLFLQGGIAYCIVNEKEAYYGITGSYRF